MVVLVAVYVVEVGTLVVEVLWLSASKIDLVRYQR